MWRRASFLCLVICITLCQGYEQAFAAVIAHSLAKTPHSISEITILRQPPQLQTTQQYMNEPRYSAQNSRSRTQLPSRMENSGFAPNAKTAPSPDFFENLFDNYPLDKKSSERWPNNVGYSSQASFMQNGNINSSPYGIPVSQPISNGKPSVEFSPYETTTLNNNQQNFGGANGYNNKNEYYDNNSNSQGFGTSFPKKDASNDSSFNPNNGFGSLNKQGSNSYEQTDRDKSVTKPGLLTGNSGLSTVQSDTYNNGDLSSQNGPNERPMLFHERDPNPLFLPDEKPKITIEYPPELEQDLITTTRASFSTIPKNRKTISKGNSDTYRNYEMINNGQ